MSSGYTWNERKRVWTRHDGKSQRTALVSADLDALSRPAPIESHPEASTERRARALDQAVEECLMSGGTVLKRDQLSAIVGQKRPVAHWWHVAFCILTLGLWLTPYLIIVVARKDVRYRIDVDRWGHVWPTIAP